MSIVPSESTPAPAAAPGRAALAFVLINVVLDAMAFGVIAPLLPKLVEAFLHGDTRRAAQAYGLFETAWAFMQLIFSPLMGALSDRFGRRPVILLSNFGLGLSYLMMAMAPTLGWLFAGRVASGITAASLATANAYVADVTPPQKRASAFGMLGAAWGLGFVLGPALGGLLGGISLHLPFWAAGGLALINAVYGLFVLPESCPPERRTPFDWRRANPLGSLALLRSNPQLLGLGGVNFLFSLAYQVLPSIYVLYAYYRYGWSEREMGLLLAVVGGFNIVVQGVLVRRVVARVGEPHALLAGLLCGAVGFTIYGLAASGTVFWLGVPVFALIGLIQPALHGLMTRYVSPSEQGQLQGASSSLWGISGLVGPTLFTQTFAVFTKNRAWYLPGAPFLLAMLVLLAAMALAWWVHPTKKEY